MYLNTIKPSANSTHAKKRVGRGIGCHGKTCGRGHKGQKARAGGFHKLGFEGGQMPLQRRLPKSGFTSRVSLISDEIRLNELAKVTADVINIETLQKAGLISSTVERVKIILSGKLDKAVHIVGLGVTKGARKAIEAAGGKVE